MLHVAEDAQCVARGLSYTGSVEALAAHIGVDATQIQTRAVAQHPRFRLGHGVFVNAELHRRPPIFRP